MHVTLDGSLAAVIKRKVESGGHRDAGDVIQEEIGLVEERDRRLAQLRAEIAVDLAQIERGELIAFTPELLDQLSREAAENARNGKPVKDAVKP